MATYRLYFLNAKGRIVSAHEFDSPDDETAIAELARHRNPFGLELWQLSRFVHKVEPQAQGTE